MFVQAQSICEAKVDTETAAPAYYPRINTWSGGLNEMEEDWLPGFWIFFTATLLLLWAGVMN